MQDIVIRDANDGDFAAIVALNHDFEHFTSPMDLARTEQLDSWSRYHRVAEVDGKIAAFLLVMGPNSAYDSENYRWFDQRGGTFLYVDRIVIDANCQGAGLGRRLYEDLFRFAADIQVSQVCCEFNLVPVNDISAGFHARLGFEEVGQRQLDSGNKVLSMQSRRL